eukprot:9812334-Lingulodinium_polyedra.AAC.1
MRRLPAQRRWDRGLLDAIKGTPWAPTDGETDRPVPIAISLETPPLGELPPATQGEPIQIRRMKIPRT